MSRPALLGPALRLAVWMTAARKGFATPHQAVEQVLGDGPEAPVNALVAGPDGAVATPLAAALGRWLDRGARATVAVPEPGDPLGLAGPPAFNALALDAGEAMLLPALGVGLVPALDARTLVLHVHPAEPALAEDPREAARQLRRSLVEATQRLAELDVAAWQPEIPDLLANLRHRSSPVVPRDWSAADLETLERALLCRDIVALARLDDGGAVSAREMAERRACLRDLDRAARRALVAVCSDSLEPR